MLCLTARRARARASAASQVELEDRLTTESEDFARGGAPFGVLWITVDQAHELRKTHGASACEEMLDRVERTLANGLRATEELGRWGQDEFLVMSHERTPEMLAAHAQVLAGLARTADFRWWGDRISLTVSIGAAQAEAGRDADAIAGAGAERDGGQASKRAAITLHRRREGTHVCHHRNSCGVWRNHHRLPDGEGPHCGSAATGRVVDYRRRGNRHPACGQPGSHSQGHCRGAGRRAERIEVRQGTVSEHAAR